MPTGWFTGIDEHPIVFMAVVVACDSLNDTAAHALPKALAHFAFCHLGVFQGRSARPLRERRLRHPSRSGNLSSDQDFNRASIVAIEPLAA